MPLSSITDHYGLMFAAEYIGNSRKSIIRQRQQVDRIANYGSPEMAETFLRLVIDAKPNLEICDRVVPALRKIGTPACVDNLNEIAMAYPALAIPVAHSIKEIQARANTNKNLKSAVAF